jgi:hypothetical protein
MIYALLVLLTGLSISAVAAYYSIIGLTTIFSGAILAVAIMGSVLEVGKLVTASWLYRNWSVAGFLMKTYLTIAVIVLMFITSMGIFGFLSKAHLEQTASTGDNSLQIELIDNKITREQKRISDANIVIAQLDKSVQVLIDYDRIRGPSGAIATREGQKEERNSLNNIINEASDNIAGLQEKKLILEKEVLAFEVEVGPIKYIADLIYGEKAKDFLDESVRYVILILIVVFDPLAILLMIAANMSLKQVFIGKNNNSNNDPPNPPSSNQPTTKWLDEEMSKKLKFEEPTPESLREMPEITDFSNVVVRKGFPLRDVYNELEDDKKVKEPKNLIEFADSLPEPESSVLIDDKPLLSKSEENAEQKTWADKILSRTIRDKHVTEALDMAYKEANGNASVPFNLNSPEGEALKRLIISNILKKLNNID